MGFGVRVSGWRLRGFGFGVGFLGLELLNVAGVCFGFALGFLRRTDRVSETGFLLVLVCKGCL